MGSDIYNIWEACNSNKWFCLRKELIDDAVSKTQYRATTNIDLIELENAYTDDKEYRHFYAKGWIEKHVESGYKHLELANAIIDWFKNKKDIRGLKIVSEVAAYMFTREDSDNLRQIIIGHKELTPYFQNMDFYIKSRSLQ